ncbi:hypothetical protein HDU97_009676 [Phlyctochytrium planicorne]|nr:hypothetical protein HDU97_009676 [Phlyctochytrium planicorne]
MEGRSNLYEEAPPPPPPQMEQLRAGSPSIISSASTAPESLPIVHDQEIHHQQQQAYQYHQQQQHQEFLTSPNSVHPSSFNNHNNSSFASAPPPPSSVAPPPPPHFDNVLAGVERHNSVSSKRSGPAPSTLPRTTPTLGSRFADQVMAWKADVVKKSTEPSLSRTVSRKETTKSSEHSMHNGQSNAFYGAMPGGDTFVGTLRRMAGLVPPAPTGTLPRGAAAAVTPPVRSQEPSKIDQFLEKVGMSYLSKPRLPSSSELDAEQEAYYFNRSMRRRRCFFVIFIIIGVFLAVFFPIGYTYWPRFPEIRVLNLTLIEDGLPAYRFILPKNTTNLNDLAMEVRLQMAVSVFNPNVYDLELEELKLNANLNTNRTELASGRKPESLGLGKFIGDPPVNNDPNYQPSYDPNIGSALRGGGITFPARGNLTFIMNFTLHYEPDKVVGLLKDPGFGEVLQVCGITRPKQRPAKVSYDAISTVKRLSKIGYFPRVQNSVFIRCPASDEQIQKVIQQAQDPNNSMSIVEILQNSFNS